MSTLIPLSEFAWELERKASMHANQGPAWHHAFNVLKSEALNENTQLKEKLELALANITRWREEAESLKQVELSLFLARTECGECQVDANRYRFLRNAPIDAVHQGGIFCGKTPENVVINGIDLDSAIDLELLKNVYSEVNKHCFDIKEII